MNNIVQKKLVAAAMLLLEARALAKANADEMREQSERSSANERRIDDVVRTLVTNSTVTIEGLISLAERANLILHVETPDKEMLDKDTNWVFRRNKELIP